MFEALALQGTGFGGAGLFGGSTELLKRLEPLNPWWSCWYYGSADILEDKNG